MGGNLELVRSIYADWGRGDFSATEWAHPDIEFVMPDGVVSGSWTGVTEMARAWREVLQAWADFHAELETCEALDDARVLVLTENSGRGRTSGVDVGQIRTRGANVFHIRNGKVTRLVAYWHRDRALIDLGLADEVMSEESTTPDLVELVRKQFEALNRRDLDGVMSSVAEDGVLDGRADLIEGRAAIRGFLDEWFGAYEELDYELEEVSHLGGGVVFAVVIQDGRLVGSDGRVRQREGWVYLWVGGSIARLTTSEVDEARAAAERLAEERG
jgi:ketosteroid isomerase-like protein